MKKRKIVYKKYKKADKIQNHSAFDDLEIQPPMLLKKNLKLYKYWERSNKLIYESALSVIGKDGVTE